MSMDVWNSISIDPLEGQETAFPDFDLISAFYDRYIEPLMWDVDMSGTDARPDLGFAPSIGVAGWTNYTRDELETWARLCSRHYPVRVTLYQEASDAEHWEEQQEYVSGKRVRRLASGLVDTRVSSAVEDAQEALQLAYADDADDDADAAVRVALAHLIEVLS